MRHTLRSGRPIMTFAFRSKSLFLSAMLALASGAAVGCSADSSADAADDGTGGSSDDITSVDQSKVKRQSIGNCWIYAVTSWLEALNKAASGQEQNTSES